MAIPQKGTRKIVVDGEPYRWLIRRKATRMQADYGVGFLHVAVEHGEEKGSTLLIKTNRAHPKDWGTQVITAITPKNVESWIYEAIAAGWNPKANGPTFELSHAHNTRAK